MNNVLRVVKVDLDYCNYLRKFDNKVPYNYGNKDSRPFIGVLFEVNNLKYFAPLSSPKPKHLKIKGKIDLLKIDGGLLGVINFNNMIPVTDNNIDLIDLNKKTSDRVEKRYLILLKKQLYWLNRNIDILYNRSQKLYYNYINDKLPDSIYERCCNFSLLEIKCNEYNNSLIKN